MALNPVPAITFATLFALFVSVISGSAATVQELPECSSAWNFVTGCDNAFSKFLAIGVIGTIPGAPTLVNALFGVVGLACRTTILWAIIEWFRGT